MEVPMLRACRLDGQMLGVGLTLRASGLDYMLRACGLDAQC